MLFQTPQRGGYRHDSKLLSTLIENFLLWFARTAGHVDFENSQLQNFTKFITSTPTLLIHGKDDLFVSRDEFETIKTSLAHTPHAALITSNPHVINHLKQAHLYACIVKLFFETTIQNFDTLLQQSAPNEHAIKNLLTSNSEIKKVTKHRYEPPQSQHKKTWLQTSRGIIIKTIQIGGTSILGICLLSYFNEPMRNYTSSIIHDSLMTGAYILECAAMNFSQS